MRPTRACHPAAPATGSGCEARCRARWAPSRRSKRCARPQHCAVALTCPTRARAADAPPLWPACGAHRWRALTRPRGAARARRDAQNCPEPCRLENSHLEAEALLLTGTIPNGWATLRNLTRLGISGNQLTGTLPSWLAGLPSLAVVGVNNNALSGSIGLLSEGAPALTYFYAHHNKFGGTLYASAAAATALRRGNACTPAPLTPHARSGLAGQRPSDA
jgi:hypothetical protein